MNEENGIVREIGLEIQKKSILVEKDIIEIFKYLKKSCCDLVEYIVEHSLSHTP